MAHVYRCYAPDGGLLYAGMSLNALRRLTEHKDTSVWFGSLATLTVDHFPTRTEALAAEKQAIAMEKPLYNRTHHLLRLRRPSQKMDKEWSETDARTHSERIRAGQALARAQGRVGGRRLVYPDRVIRDAIRRHEAGETWAATAAALGISLENLYTRLRKLRREEANAKE